MPIAKERKTELVSDLAKELKSSQAVIITDYRGLLVADMQALRRELRGMKAGYRVAKNTLLKLALKQSGLPAPAELLDGPTAVAFISDDIAGPAKKLTDFFKEKGLPIRGAIVGHTVYDAKGVESLANLPTRPQLYASILGSLQGPAANLVGVLNEVYSQLVRVLDARAEQGGTA